MRNTQNTSILAYQEVILHLGERQLAVLKALKEIQPANNRIIAQFMHRPINTLTPRINELRKKGLVILDGTYEDPITKKQTLFWRTQLR